MKPFYYRGWTIRYNESFPFPNKWEGSNGKQSVYGKSRGQVELLIDDLILDKEN